MAPPKIPDTDVLVAGAGPTGLVLALWLTRLGVRVRIIDKATEPGTTSRALAVQARTLEFYRQLGFADQVVERGVQISAINMWARGKRVGHADFSEVGKGLSPFSYVLVFPQEQHEHLLIEQLERANVRVERGTELLDFADRDVGIAVRLKRLTGEEEVCTAAYLAGCDGARSRVRECIGTGFPGGTYERIFYVADVQVAGPVADHELHVTLDDADFLIVFPMKGDGAVRLVGAVLPEALERDGALTWDDVSRRAMERLSITVKHVNWFSTYHVHHRVAEHFRAGRVFLLGDAAHIHSPVGGQGMNTGIGDAVNLGWKLAAVIQGRAGEELLGSYEPERSAFAKRLVATTDRAFTFVTNNGPFARIVRFKVIPLLIPWLAARDAVRRFMFRTISQTLVNYRQSDMSEGKAGIASGDRLPWVPPEQPGGADNFAPLASLDWQVHIYGDAAAALARVCEERQLLLYVVPWRPIMRRTGLKANAAYLLRPDGYVALADAGASAVRLERYLDAHAIQSISAR